MPSGDRGCPGYPRSSTPEIFLKDCQTQRYVIRVCVRCGRTKRSWGSDILSREILKEKNRTRRRRITVACERTDIRLGRLQKNFRVQLLLGKSQSADGTKLDKTQFTRIIKYLNNCSIKDFSKLFSVIGKKIFVRRCFFYLLVWRNDRLLERLSMKSYLFKTRIIYRSDNLIIIAIHVYQRRQRIITTSKIAIILTQ